VNVVWVLEFKSILLYLIVKKFNLMMNIKKATLALLLIFIFGTTASAQGTWSAIAPFGGGAVGEARAFSIGNYGYIGAATQTLWQYDPVSDIWTQMASMPGVARPSAAGFSIGTKGYFGTGGALNDFYEYDQPTNSWTQKANFGGSAREGALGIAISGKGYIGTGGGSYLNDWWEYDPATNSWTQKANLAGPGRYHGGAFAINDKGYVCTGFNGNFYNDLWEYDPVTNAWTAKASLPGITRDRPVGVSAGGKGYIVTGWTGTSSLNDAWEYDPVTDSWTALPAFPGTARYNACGFGIGNNVYVGTGTPATATMYVYGPSCTVQANAVATTCSNNCDGIAGVAFPSGSATYLWSNGNTTASISGLCAGVYTVTVTDSLGCSAAATVTVVNGPAISGTSTVTSPLCFGDNNGQACYTPTGGTQPYSYQWAIGDTTDCIDNVPAGLYVLTITDATGCTGQASVTVTQPAPLTIFVNAINASCSSCTDGSASANPAGGTIPYSYLWSTGAVLPFINNLAPGTYTCCVTDFNACVSCDTFSVSFTSGIDDPAGFYFSAGPNPFTDVLTITVADVALLPAPFKLYDISGRLMMHGLLEKEINVLDAVQLDAGIYIVEIPGKGFVENRKLIKANR
jgi:N-acetylneuraminic acid mutarotase